MSKIRLFLNGMAALMMVLTALGASPMTAHAGNGNDDPKADPRLLQMAEENPDAVFMVIVQKEAKNKDLKDMEVEGEVLKGGGQVKKQLDLILSFSAELTGKEIVKLARHPKVRWISVDAPVVSTAAGDPAVLDSFSSASYSNNNGSKTWAGNWIETGDGTASASSGYVKISNSQLQLSSTNRTLSRQANLAGATFANLSFQYRRSSFDNSSDYVSVLISANGGTTWAELARYIGAGTDSSWQTGSFDILGYAASNTQIRFATSSVLGTSDILYIDNVKIEYALAPATFVVNSTSDSSDASIADGICQTSTTGQCTLRAAIQQANASTGRNMINFNISGAGPHNIQPASALPEITEAVVIDGSSEPDFVTNGNKPIVVLSGVNGDSESYESGLTLAGTADGSVIRGLVIQDWTADGIRIQVGSDNNVIFGNYIGRLTNTGAAASSGMQNAGVGIYVEGSNNIIGGTDAASRNIISGNDSDGITIIGSGATNNVIQGNYIGTTAAGNAALGNGGENITIDGAVNTLIGGTNTGAGNVIGAGGQEGIWIIGGATGTVVQGNWIGTDTTGTVNLGNTHGGIRIGNTYGYPANSNLIGGTETGAGNVIAFNNEVGVAVDRNANGASISNAILGNSIYSNNGLGIDLDDLYSSPASSGVTANDAGDADTGGNNRQNFPVITSAISLGCYLTVTGYVGTAPNQQAGANIRVEFFKASSDTSGYGEGQTFLGHMTTNSNGNFSGYLVANGAVSGMLLTATATDANNNTSEFGPNFQSTGFGTCVSSPYTKINRKDQVAGSLQGQGVTVAVVDSGISKHTDLEGRVIANSNQTNEADAFDNYVHGTHVAGIIGGNGTSSGGIFAGMAPQVNLVNVKVSNQQGIAYTSDLVDGLQWIYNNKAAHNIRVVNISMNSTVAESYHNSPLNAAVEILWFNGIVVVVSAGNNGSTAGPSTIYPPANDPFVITVGATEDYGTPVLSDDAVAAFSAYGTTESNFAKPDLVAPGRNIISLLAGTNTFGYINHPAHRIDTSYFRMTGTSMSAPMVTGAVALLLQDEPNLTPDQVKYRLMATANKTWAGYNASKAGAGYLDVYAAVNGTTTESANQGIFASQLLSTGSEPIAWSSVGWNSVGWNSVGWNSVGWNSVGWNSVGWNTVGWNTVGWSSSIWDD